MAKKSNYKGMIPKKLFDDIKNGKCILFVGAGISAQVKRSNGKVLPVWKSMLMEMLDWAIDNGIGFWNDSNDIKEMIDKNNLLMAAQELQDMIGNANCMDFYNKIFRDKNVKPAEVHKIIPNIPFRAIITTNYDTLIEGAFALHNGGALPPIFTQNDLDDKNSFLKYDDFFIFKMHGHIDRNNTIVLGERDYQNIIHRNPVYRQFVETIFSIYSVLFVGFGGVDDDLDEVINKLSIFYSRTIDRHYMLTEKNKFNITERRRLLLDKKLEIIEYEKDDEHSQVREFFKEINMQLKREEDTIYGDKSNEIMKSEGRKKVFLSGSFKDKEEIMKIYDALKKNNIEVWMSEKELKAGDFIAQEIANAIQESKYMIVLITENSMKSTWVKNEIEVAIFKQLYDKTIRVIPVIVGNVQIPSYLNQILCLKVKDNFLEEDLLPIISAINKEY